MGIGSLLEGIWNFFIFLRNTCTPCFLLMLGIIAIIITIIILGITKGIPLKNRGGGEI